MILRVTLGILALLMLAISSAVALDWPFKPQVVTVASAPPSAGVDGSDRLTRCVVVNVFDGDTFSCDLSGDGRVSEDWEKVRLLGVDTPEMHYSRKNTGGQDEPFAEAASLFARQHLYRKPVYLEYDQQVFDRYGRTLAYVYLDPQGERMMNRMLVQAGLARVVFLGMNRRYEVPFQQDQAKARTQRKGMWQGG